MEVLTLSRWLPATAVQRGRIRAVADLFHIRMAQIVAQLRLPGEQRRQSTVLPVIHQFHQTL